MACYTGGETSVAVGGAKRPCATAIRVTPGFFAVFGARPERGRVSEPADESPPGSPLAAVVGHEFWMRRFRRRRRRRRAAPSASA